MLGSRLLAAFADGVELFSSDCGDSLASFSDTLEAAAPAFSGVVLGGSKLIYLDPELNEISRVPAPEDEPIRALLDLGQNRLLTLSDDESVRLWTLEEEQLVLARQWPVGCVPLAAKGKAVLCLERGRLQERDPLSGTILKTWKHKQEIATASVDAQAQGAIVVDSAGAASYWDLAGRECVFSFDCPFRVNSGTLAAGATRGWLLGADGELASFRVVEGGSVHPASDLPPLVSVCLNDENSFALDENGGIWNLGTSERIGGSWAGWATSSLGLTDGRILVGTANGEILAYQGGASQSWQPHQDAILGLLEHGGDVWSVGADSRVVRYPAAALDQGHELHNFLGEAVISALLARDGSLLWLALEEGRVAWLDPLEGRLLGEHRFPEHCLEEIRPGAEPNQLLVLTDKGSVKLLTA